MPIITQSASVSYSPYLMLPAPQIAGLLPATTGTRDQQQPPTFTYTNPFLADMPTEGLFEATRTLLDVAIAHTRGELNDHALNTALALFRRAVTGQPMRPKNPAQFNAEMDAPILDLLMTTARRRKSQ